MEKIPATDHLRELLEAQLARIEESERGVRVGTDARELHRFRVAGRRSRALIRASRKLLGDQLARLNAELRWLGGVTGPVRDLDVLIAHLSEVVDDLEPDREGGEAILAALAEERIWARDVLADALDSERYRDLLALFRTSLERLSAVDADVSLRKLARKEFRRLRKRYKALGPAPPDDELHALRIKAKRVRYAAELAALADGPRFERVVEAATEVQDLIGAHQDAVVAEKRVRAVAPSESLLAAGRIVELERARREQARASLPRIWKRLERAAEKAF